MQYERSVQIAAGTDVVWSVMSDVTSWPQWTASIRSVQLLEPGPLAVGSRVRIQQPKLPTAVWEVTELEPGRGFTWTNRGPGMTSTGGHRIVSTTDGTSSVTLRIEQVGPGALLAWLFLPLTRRYVQMEAAGLKSRCEQVTG